MATGKPAAKKPSRTKANKIDAGMRHQMIAEAAYYRAEQRGFAGDGVLQDWLEAEFEIDRRLRS